MLKLKPPPKNPKMKRSVALRQSTLHTLESYARVFAEQYAEPIEMDELIDRMLQEFMATDRAFQKHRHAPAATTAQEGG